MSNHEELVKALRHCVSDEKGVTKCAGCPYCPDITGCIDRLHTDAAAAIEALQAEVNKPITLKQAINRLRELGWLQEHDKTLTEPINDLQARLGEAENSVENYKRMWLEKHEPKTARWEGWTSTHWSKRCDSNGDPIYTEHTYYQCSYCGRRTVVRENFCPNCGAVMEDMCEVQE